MSVEKLPDGRWIVRYKKGFNSEDPERTREYFGRGREGEASARKRDADLKDRRKAKRLSPLFSEIANEYIMAHVSVHPKTSLKNLIWKMSGIIFPRIGHIEAIALNHKELTKYVNGRINDGVKKTTIHRELSDIRAILNWAEKERFIVESPFKGFTMPRRDDSFIQPTTDAEFEAIIKNAAPHIVRAMLLSYYTGLRPGVAELFSLKWDNINWNDQTITIISAEKGGIPVRTIPLNPHLLQWLEKWAKEDAEKGIESIVHYKGNQIRTSMKTAWKAAIKRAGITKNIRPYSMRHKTVSDMLSSGADIKSTAEIVGHKDTRTTMQIYQQTTNKMKREAVELLGKPPIEIENGAPLEGVPVHKKIK